MPLTPTNNHLLNPQKNESSFLYSNYCGNIKHDIRSPSVLSELSTSNNTPININNSPYHKQPLPPINSYNISPQNQMIQDDINTTTSTNSPRKRTKKRDSKSIVTSTTRRSQSIPENTLFGSPPETDNSPLISSSSSQQQMTIHSRHRFSAPTVLHHSSLSVTTGSAVSMNSSYALQLSSPLQPQYQMNNSPTNTDIGSTSPPLKMNSPRITKSLHHPHMHHPSSCTSIENSCDIGYVRTPQSATIKSFVSDYGTTQLQQQHHDENSPPASSHSRLSSSPITTSVRVKRADNSTEELQQQQLQQLKHTRLFPLSYESQSEPLHLRSIRTHDHKNGCYQSLHYRKLYQIIVDEVDHSRLILGLLQEKTQLTKRLETQNQFQDDMESEMEQLESDLMSEKEMKHVQNDIIRDMNTKIKRQEEGIRELNSDYHALFSLYQELFDNHQQLVLHLQQQQHRQQQQELQQSQLQPNNSTVHRLNLSSTNSSNINNSSNSHDNTVNNFDNIPRIASPNPRRHHPVFQSQLQQSESQKRNPYQKMQQNFGEDQNLLYLNTNMLSFNHNGSQLGDSPHYPVSPMMMMMNSDGCLSSAAKFISEESAEVFIPTLCPTSQSSISEEFELCGLYWQVVCQKRGTDRENQCTSGLCLSSCYSSCEVKAKFRICLQNSQVVWKQKSSVRFGYNMIAWGRDNFLEKDDMNDFVCTRENRNGSQEQGFYLTVHIQVEEARNAIITA